MVCPSDLILFRVPALMGVSCQIVTGHRARKRLRMAVSRICHRGGYRRLVLVIRNAFRRAFRRFLHAGTQSRRNTSRKRKRRPFGDARDELQRLGVVIPPETTAEGADRGGPIKDRKAPSANLK